jgi:hypothetical protein
MGLTWLAIAAQNGEEARENTLKLLAGKGIARTNGPSAQACDGSGSRSNSGTR